MEFAGDDFCFLKILHEILIILMTKYVGTPLIPSEVCRVGREAACLHSSGPVRLLVWLVRSSGSRPESRQPGPRTLERILRINFLPTCTLCPKSLKHSS